MGWQSFAQCNTDALKKRSLLKPGYEMEKRIFIRTAARMAYQNILSYTKDMKDATAFLRNAIRTNQRPDIGTYIIKAESLKKQMEGAKKMKETEKLDAACYSYYCFAIETLQYMSNLIKNRKREELKTMILKYSKEIAPKETKIITAIQSESDYIEKTYPITVINSK